MAGGPTALRMRCPITATALHFRDGRLPSPRKSENTISETTTGNHRHGRSLLPKHLGVHLLSLEGLDRLLMERFGLAFVSR